MRGRRRRRGAGRILSLAGVVILVGVGVWQLTATLWLHHSQQAGRSLVQQFLHNHALSSPVTTPTSGSGATPSTSITPTASLASCGSSGADPVAGLLEIPKLGVVAPVEQGVTDTVLAVAVGHLRNSVWPGKNGNAVLEAHDVSYFVGLASLGTGDTFSYVTPCTTYQFTVAGHEIVTEGSPVYNSATPTATLITCWPTNALWFTPDRYLVNAKLSGTAPTEAGHQYLTATAPPTVPVPSALAAKGVTLANYSLPMGTFTLTGTPDPAWAQTTNPLLDQGQAVEEYIAAIKALTANRLDWFAALAPALSPPATLVGASNPQYLSALDVTLQVTGQTPTAVSLSDTIQVTGGPAPGRYSQTVTETVSGGTVLITGWTLARA